MVDWLSVWAEPLGLLGEEEDEGVLCATIHAVQHNNVNVRKMVLVMANTPDLVLVTSGVQVKSLAGCSLPARDRGETIWHSLDGCWGSRVVNQVRGQTDLEGQGGPHSSCIPQLRVRGHRHRLPVSPHCAGELDVGMRAFAGSECHISAQDNFVLNLDISPDAEVMTSVREC